MEPPNDVLPCERIGTGALRSIGHFMEAARCYWRWVAERVGDVESMSVADSTVVFSVARRAAGPGDGLMVLSRPARVAEIRRWSCCSGGRTPRVGAKIRVLGAGPRALLLQIAHPAVAAGVADHSDFRADPWRRLAGTLQEPPGPSSTARPVRLGPRSGDSIPCTDHHRARLRGARPRAVAVGPRDAHRLDDRRRGRLAGAS